MRISAFLTIPIATLIVATACDRREETAREEAAVAASEDRGYRTDQPVDVHAVPDTAGGLTFTGNLVELHNSGVTGVVTVTPVDGGSQIHLSLTGVQPNTHANVTIERGLCQEAGQVVEVLEPIRVEATGAAVTTARVNRPVGTFADGRHSIRIYPEQGMRAPPVACADMPTPAEPAPL